MHAATTNGTTDQKINHKKTKNYTLQQPQILPETIMSHHTQTDTLKNNSPTI